MTNESNTTTQAPGPTTLAVNTAIAILPIIAGALNPVAGALAGAAIEQWEDYRRRRGLSAEHVVTTEDIADFRADLAANSAAANHARARAAVGLPPTPG